MQNIQFLECVYQVYYNLTNYSRNRTSPISTEITETEVNFENQKVMQMSQNKFGRCRMLQEPVGGDLSIGIAYDPNILGIRALLNNNGN